MPWKKVPHPNGTDANVGVMLSKDFAKDAETGRLSSQDPAAQEALDIAVANSYWTSVRNRVFDRHVRVVENPEAPDSPALISIPQILPHGTTTRRTVEALMVTLCSTKPKKIGSELKTRIEAPKGWVIVGADVDGEELAMASIYCDQYENEFIGSSALGYYVLGGSKILGTDCHTQFAKSMMEEEYEGIIYDEKLGVLEEI